MRDVRLFLATLAVGFTLTGVNACSSRETPSSVSSRDRATYEGDAERRLAALGARIDSLKAEADSAGYELRARLEDLERKREVAREKFGALKSSAAERWSAVKTEAAEALDELSESVERLRRSDRDTTRRGT